MCNNEFNNEENNKESEILNEYTEDVNESPEKKKKSPGRELFEWVQAIVIAVVLAVVIRNFVFNVVKVDGSSMEGTLQNGDRMVVWRLGYDAESGDIVVFKNTSTNGAYWIKRVIATEGQHVEIDYNTNSVYVDGKKIDETYINDCQCSDCSWHGGDDMVDMGFAYNELTVPKGCVFVMGDNRNHSRDGRAIGPVSENDILGKAILRFWPLKNIKTY